MSNKLKVECSDTENALNLLKLVVRDGDCEDWLTCDNASDSIESIIKRLIVETDDGLAVAVCGCNGGGSSDILFFDIGDTSTATPTEAEMIAGGIPDPSTLSTGYEFLMRNRYEVLPDEWQYQYWEGHVISGQFFIVGINVVT